MEINNIKAAIHLKNSIDYIMNEEKTMGQVLVDTYKCGAPEDVIDAFKYIRNKEVIQKGNNIAWTIMQSFSPDDNVTPEQALEIGKELMKRMYPNHQYIIATHVDREHIHNHIILNSVNFEDYHKLNCDNGHLEKLRKMSDDLCREHNLSVIKATDKSKKRKLQEAMDKAIEEATSFSDFLAIMQEKGYNINYGNKYISFKNAEMGRYMRSSSISYDYTIGMIKHRIKSKKSVDGIRRNIYDDKIDYKSKRKILQFEIEESLKKVKTFDEFIEDMARKGFQAKQGKHLAFKGENFERFVRVDSLKDKNGNAHYTEAMLRFRIESKGEYEELMRSRTTKIINITGKQGGLRKWAEKENAKIIDSTRKFCSNLTGFEDGGWYGPEIMYAVFIPEYEKRKEELERQRQVTITIDGMIKEFEMTLKAMDMCSRLRPIIKSYESIEVSDLNNRDLKIYKSNNSKWNYYAKVIEQSESKYGKISAEMFNTMLNMLREDQSENKTILAKQEIEFENWENVRYNFEAVDGFNVTPEEANKALDEQLRREKEIREKKKNSIVKRFVRR